MDFSLGISLCRRSFSGTNSPERGLKDAATEPAAQRPKIAAHGASRGLFRKRTTFATIPLIPQTLAKYHILNSKFTVARSQNTVITLWTVLQDLNILECQAR